MVTVMKIEMLKNGFTGRELARKVGIDEGQLSVISTGKLSCPEKWKKPIAQQLNLPENRLFDCIGRAKVFDEK